MIKSAAPKQIASKPSINIPKASPQMPWAGQKGTMEDLGAFGISPEEFFGGGGRIMFGDTAPKPAPTIAPKQGSINTTQQQAYINGFVKRASEYGIAQDNAVALLKKANALTKAISEGKVSRQTLSKYFGEYIADDLLPIMKHPRGLNRHQDVKALDSLLKELSDIRNARGQITTEKRIGDFAKKQDSLRDARLGEQELDTSHKLFEKGTSEAPSARRALQDVRSKQQASDAFIHHPTEVQKEIMRVQGNAGEKVPSRIRELKKDYQTGERAQIPYNNPEQPLHMRTLGFLP